MGCNSRPYVLVPSSDSWTLLTLDSGAGVTFRFHVHSLPYKNLIEPAKSFCSLSLLIITKPHHQSHHQVSSLNLEIKNQILFQQQWSSNDSTTTLLYFHVLSCERQISLKMSRHSHSHITHPGDHCNDLLMHYLTFSSREIEKLTNQPGFP